MIETMDDLGDLEEIEEEEEEEEPKKKKKQHWSEYLLSMFYATYYYTLNDGSKLAEIKR